MEQLKQMVQMYKNSQNPNTVLQNMLNQNPNFKEVMSLVSQGGGNAQQVFYNLAKQMGVDPQMVLKQLGI